MLARSDSRVEAAGVTCGGPFGPVLGRLVDGPEGEAPTIRLVGSNPRPRFELRSIRRGFSCLLHEKTAGTRMGTGRFHGGGGSRTRVRERFLSSFYVRRSL